MHTQVVIALQPGVGVPCGTGVGGGTPSPPLGSVAEAEDLGHAYGEERGKRRAAR